MKLVSTFNIELNSSLIHHCVGKLFWRGWPVWHWGPLEVRLLFIPKMISYYLILVLYFMNWFSIPCFTYRLEIEGSGETWRQDQRVRLQHVDTGGYLHSHNKKYSRIAGAQQEVLLVIHILGNNLANVPFGSLLFNYPATQFAHNWLLQSMSAP